MADYRYDLFDLRSYLQIFHFVLFGPWDDAPKPRDRHESFILISQAAVLTAVVTAATGLTMHIFLGQFDWKQAAVGVAVGVAAGAVFGVYFGLFMEFIGGVAAGVATGVATGVIGGIYLGFFFGAAAGIAEGVAFGVAAGVVASFIGVIAGIVSVFWGVAFGVVGGVTGATALFAFQRIEGLIDNPISSAIALVASFVVALVLFSVGLLVVDLLSLAVTYWRPRHQWKEWFGAMVLVAASSAGLGRLMSTLAGSLNLETISAITVASVFVLIYTRLPLWPLEALWGALVCWRLFRKRAGKTVDAANLAREIRRAFFDRQMILPLPGEGTALRRLASMDETMAIRESAQLLYVSNHCLVGVSVLRDLAARNPIEVQVRLNAVLPWEEVRERNFRYVAEKLPEASARVWSANRRLHALSGQLTPAAKGVRKEGILKHVSRLVAVTGDRARTESDSLTVLLKNLREIVEEFAAAQAWQADLRHVETHLLLYRALVSALEAESVDCVAAFGAPTLPEVELLYPAELREALDGVAAIATRARGYAEATSPVTRGRHLLEAQEDLQQIEPSIDKVPAAAGPFLALVVLHWRRLFAATGGELARGHVAEPVPQPYVIANPVVGEGFVGREDIVRRLEELWAVPGQRPSVVLYGHRRMGKSSILQNLHGEQFDAKTRIVDFNLQTFGLVPSTGALLHNLALELHDACVAAIGATGIAEPDPAPFEREPYGAFKRFLRRLDRGDLRFIVTMDEFETLEERIRGGRLRADLIDYLRGVITTQTWLTLAFAGLHTLREMTEDYWHPLFGSVEAIPVSFLTAGATRRLLSAPAPDFAVDYSGDALDFIYALTQGQPYLTQLIGHSLVTRLNEQMFEQQVERELRFDRADVEAVIGTEVFYRTGGAYFQGIWAQASQGPPGQQEILRALAAGPASAAEIAASDAELAASDAEIAATEAALDALRRHDVVTAVDDGGVRRWRCTVELMRRWLGQQ